jgi:hypothetical protein
MNPKARRIITTLGTLFFVFVLVPLSSILVTSWRSRWEASRLLACARTIRPGKMTEVETRKALSNFDQYLLHGEESISGHPTVTRDSYWISNYPDWVIHLAPHLPNWVNNHIWCLPYTTFSVSPRFENGELLLLELREAQDHRDDIHPFAAIVRIYSTSSEQRDPALPYGFTGFSVSPYEEGELDASGKQIGSTWIVYEYVTLDERASPEQLSDSFRFHLDCLTSLFGCHDARKILPIKD